MVRQVLPRSIPPRVISLAVSTIAALALVACTSAAPPPSTVQPPAPAPTKAAEPTKAPAAPTKAAEPTKAPAPQPTAAPAKTLDYPAKGKTITWIIPLTTGGPGDISSRTIAPALAKELGANIEVASKPGAGGQIGYTELAGSKPDGYVIGYVSFPSIIGTYLDPDRKAVYTRKSFQPLANYVLEPNMISVRADSPYKSVKDLIDAAKARPEKIVMASASGKLGGSHLAILELEKVTGAKFSTVLFDGGGEAATALLGGHAEAASSGGGAFTGPVKSGAMRVIGIMDKQESPFYPGVKTFQAQGYDMRFALFLGTALPAGTPMEIVRLLSAGIKKAAESPELKQRMDAAGMQVRYLDTPEFTAEWDDMEKRVGPMISEWIAKERK